MSAEHDTHGQSGRGWYGFDLDGTLAEYHGWRGIAHIGDPILPMAILIRELHKQGKLVKIVTARVAPRRMKTYPYGGGSIRFDRHFPFVHSADAYEMCEQFDWKFRNVDDPDDCYRVYAHEYIKDWCMTHLGFCPPIVYEKDPMMLWLFDDRAVQVEPNTGVVLGRLPEEMFKEKEVRV